MDIKKISTELKLMRAEHNFSQIELAKASGVSECTINLIENEKAKPKMLTLAKLCDAMDEPAQRLLQYVRN